MTDAEALCADLGITYRQLDHWTRRGYLRPIPPKLNVKGKGNGYKRTWPERERMVAREMGRLLAAGFTLPAAARGARALVDNGWRDAQG